MQQTIPSSSSLMARVFGEDIDYFFQHTWRQHHLCTRGLFPELAECYPPAAFIKDYGEYNCTEVSVALSADGEQRRFIRSLREKNIGDLLREGTSLAIQLPRLEGRAGRLPDLWLSFLQFHKDLCAFVAPNFPLNANTGSAVDLISTGAKTSTGGHYDTGDVFYFVLYGSKIWTVETEPDPKRFMNMRPNEVYRDLQPENDSITIELHAGDLFYVPAYTYHRVSASGPSTAVSIGVPAFTVLSLIQARLRSMVDTFSQGLPLPTYPSSSKLLATQAEKEVARKIGEVLSVLSQHSGGIHP